MWAEAVQTCFNALFQRFPKEAVDVQSRAKVQIWKFLNMKHE
jgi:hypothetical protein